MQSHVGPVNAAAFSSDGHFFASAGADELVMVWKTNIYGVAAPEIEWGMGERPRTAPNITSSPINESLVKSTDAFTRVRSRSSSPAAVARPATVPAAPEDAKTRPKPVKPAAATSPASKQQRPLASPTEPSRLRQRMQREGVEASSSVSKMAPTGKQQRSESPEAPAPVAAAAEDRTSTPKQSTASLPSNIAKTLEQIMAQLDILTRTVTIMDQRLSLTEDRVSSLLALQHASGGSALSAPLKGGDSVSGREDGAVPSL